MKIKSVLVERPKKLFNLLLHREEIFSEIEAQNREEKWYFTKEAEEYYQSLVTPAHRVKFFYRYLRTAVVLDESIAPRAYSETLYKIAVIMARSMVEANLSFGGYPNVIDENKNPLIKFVKTKSTAKKIFEYNSYGNKLIKVLNESCSKNSVPESSYALTDIYKIEKDIVALFCIDGKTSNSFGPYVYKFSFDGNNVEEDDCDDFDEYDDSEI